MNLSIEDLVKYSKGKLISGNGNNSITKIYIDSRKVWRSEKAAFLALKGVNFDGHLFISQAYDKGVRTFIVSEFDSSYSKFHDADFIEVGDTLASLQEIAKAHRSNFDIPVIGITGSNGKTIVKEWIAQSCVDNFTVAKSPKSYNSQIGVPLSIFELSEKSSLGIFEAGISKPDEMAVLKEIINPTIGVFTNIGNAHDEFFSSHEEKAEEKAKLFASCEALVYNVDDKFVNKAVEGLNCELISWSLQSTAHHQFKIQERTTRGIKICCTTKNNFEFHIPFSDDASVQNALHLFCVLDYLNFELARIGSKISALKRVEMRLENIEGINNSLFINDVYNSDLTSLEAAMALLKGEKNRDKKQLVLSEIQNTGYSNAEIVQFIKEQLIGWSLESVHLIGKEARAYSDAFDSPTIELYNNTSEFLAKVKHSSFKDSVVLVKGSRPFELERVAEKFQKKAHRTVLEVNLSQIQENLNFYRSKLGSGVKIAAMVKAFSYGSGSHEIAEILEKNNVDYLGLAYVDEGISLRDKNIQMPIMIMNPEFAQVDLMIENKLEPVVYSKESLIHFSSYANRIELHLKFDTGMHRLGFLSNELPWVKEKIKEYGLTIKSVFTHLSSSENPDDDLFTINQLDQFIQIKEELELGNEVLFHALNTSGMTRFPRYQMDMVRLGIGLYGFSPIPDEQAFLKPAIRLKSSLSQIKQVKKGDSVGYSRAFIASEDCKIGIVPIGYADGILRTFGNGIGQVVVAGKNTRTVGNICMDMCMIDLSEIHAEVGDEVEFFGEKKPLSKTAEEMGTIAYEVLANVSQRVKRIFYFD